MKNTIFSRRVILEGLKATLFSEINKTYFTLCEGMRDNSHNIVLFNSIRIRICLKFLVLQLRFFLTVDWKDWYLSLMPKGANLNLLNIF